MITPLFGACVTFVSLALLLFAETREDDRLRWIFKPAASTGFLLVGWAAGALESSAGQVLFAGLVLAFLGDVFLIPERTFLLGLVAFLLGHVAYAVSFAVRGVDPATSAAVLAVLVLPAVVVERWLRPGIPRELYVPVLAYVAVITAMLALAVGALRLGAPPLLFLGALAFYLSDLAVARERFVASTVANRMWGLPLYYGGQIALAWSV